MATRVNVSNEAFIKACLESTNIGEVAAKTGLAPTSVQQRRVRMRNDGVALPEFTRGGERKASKLDVAAINDMIAKQLGKSAEDVSKESAALVSAHAERTAEDTLADEVEAEAKAEGKVS